MARIQSNISLCLMKSGNPELALQAAESAVKTAPSLAKAHARKGVALLELGKRTEAKEAFTLARERVESMSAAAAEYARLAESASDE